MDEMPRQKRGPGQEFEERTPRPILPLPRRKRTKSTSPRKSTIRSILENLEKPFDFKLFPATHKLTLQQLPHDVVPLYRELYNAIQKIGILPWEMHEEMDDEVPPFAFRPAPTALDAKDAQAQTQAQAQAAAEARARHARVCNIVQKAAEAVAYNRYESTWNQQVHTPLLELVFTSTPLGTQFVTPVPQRALAPHQNVSVRYEPVTDASIEFDSRPTLKAKYADSESVDSASVSNDGTYITDWSTPRIRHGDNKKVDYVLVMDMPKTARLQQEIFRAASRGDDDVPYFNQTCYRPIEQSLIAVLIETKTEMPQQDPLYQLGMWAAAWHRRMYTLRPGLYSTDISGSGAGPASASASAPDQQSYLVTLPLVQVVGHVWCVYFAADRGSSIHIHGPMTIGSTEDIVSTYVLLASLQALKHWVEGTFQQAMSAWFGVENPSSNITSAPEVSTFV